MLKTVFLIVLLAYVTGVQAQNTNPVYDKELAARLGADDYGMKMYVLVILKSGTATITDKKLTDSLFRGHMNNINRLASQGKLTVAGPFGTNDKNYRGLFILNTTSMEEARAMVNSDPVIQNKLMDVDLLPWYGSAALPEYLKYHEKVEKKKP